MVAQLSGKPVFSATLGQQQYFTTRFSIPCLVHFVLLVKFALPLWTGHWTGMTKFRMSSLKPEALLEFEAEHTCILCSVVDTACNVSVARWRTSYFLHDLCINLIKLWKFMCIFKVSLPLKSSFEQSVSIKPSNYGRELYKSLYDLKLGKAFLSTCRNLSYGFYI